MSVKNIDQFQTVLKELCKSSLDVGNQQVSFLTPIGEVLTIQMSVHVLIRFTQGVILENCSEQQIFWRYSDDAFIDVTLAMPDFLIQDILSELNRLKKAEIIGEIVEE